MCQAVQGGRDTVILLLVARAAQRNCVTVVTGRFRRLARLAAIVGRSAPQNAAALAASRRHRAAANGSDRRWAILNARR